MANNLLHLPLKPNNMPGNNKHHVIHSSHASHKSDHFQGCAAQQFHHHAAGCRLPSLT
jgi:hypothetical protein